MTHLPPPPDASGFLPAPLAHALVKAHDVVESRISAQLDPACPRDTFRHDIQAFYTLVRITKTVEDFYARHPDRRPAPEPPDDDADPSSPFAPSADSAVESDSSSPVHGASASSAISASKSSSPPSSPPAPSSFAPSAPLAVKSPSSPAVPGASASSAVSALKSSSSPSSPPAPPYACLLTPSLAKRLDRAASGLADALPVHLLTRGLRRPAMLPRDVDHLATLVGIHVTLAEVAARAPALPVHLKDSSWGRAGAPLEPFIAFALDAAALGRDPHDPVAEFEACSRRLDEQRREFDRLVDTLGLAEALRRTHPHLDAGTPSVDPAPSSPSTPASAAPAPLSPEAARTALQTFLAAAHAALDGLRRRGPSRHSPGLLDRLPPDAPLFQLPADVFAPRKSRASQASALDKSSAPSNAVSPITLVTSLNPDPEHARPLAPPASPSSPSSPSRSSHSSRFSCSSPRPRSIRTIPRLPFFPDGLLPLARSLPLDPADLLGQGASAVGRYLRDFVIERLHPVLIRLLGSIENPRRPRSPFSRARPPDPWTPRYA